MALVIVYTRAEDGGTSICRPAPLNRMVKSITVKGEKIVFDPPISIDSQVRAYKTEDLNPEWAETEQEHVERIRAKDVPEDAINVSIVDDSLVLTDRTFRDAWKHDLTVDMDKARGIWRNNMRQARAALLAALDVEYLMADEKGDAAVKAAVAAKKQALRDVTELPEIDAAETPEELKAIWPKILKGA